MGKNTFLQDFKAFAMKGNVIDMAVGVVIGGAFGKIVSSLVANVIMPPIGLSFRSARASSKSEWSWYFRLPCWAGWGNRSRSWRGSQTLPRRQK